jgi:hypothetical protein
MGAKSLMAVILCAGLIGCAQKFKPEPPLPTPEQLAALMVPSPNATSVEITDFHLEVYPRVVLAGNAVKITCYIPESLDAKTYEFGLSGMQRSTGPVEKIEYTRIIDRVECGATVAYCSIATATEVKRLTTTLTVAGCDNDGNDRDK